MVSWITEQRSYSYSSSTRARDDREVLQVEIVMVASLGLTVILVLVVDGNISGVRNS